MKILFVCRVNIFRSQIAAALFKKLCPSANVKSAGTLISENKEGQKLGERLDSNTKFVIEVLKEEVIDVSENKRRVLTEKMVGWADKIICMAERETIPEYLLQSGKIEYWHVEDAYEGVGYDFFVDSKERIRKKVEKLAKEVC